MKKLLFGLICFLSLNVISVNALDDLKLDCTKELNTKSTGATVKTLQKMLNTVANCNLKVDGGYGTQTENCVQKYQKAKKITVSKIVGPKTCKLLNEDYKNKTKVTATTTTQSTTKTTTESTTKATVNTNSTQDLKLDCTKELNTKSAGASVKTLQKMLNTVANCNLKVDGGYGTQTENCVQKYQKAKKITVSKIVGPKTCKLLNEDYINKKEVTATTTTQSTTKTTTESTTKATVNTNSTQDLKLDCTKELNTKSAGASVKTLQKMLNTVANCNLKVDGGYGTKTENCVQKYQKAKKITVSKIVGPKTCKLLNEDYKNKTKVTTTTITQSTTKTTTTKTSKEEISKEPLSSQTNSVTTLGYITLSKGNTGNNVRLLKQELNKVMNCKLEITSAFDDKTYDCVVKFQKKYNINADGKVESKTISELNKIYKYQQVIVKKNTSIRKGNSNSSSIIKSVSKGTRLNIMETPKKNANWIKVEYNGKLGYVNKSLVSLDFIEVDITSQTLRYYKDGNLFVDTIITTGKYDSSDTPKSYRTVKALKTNNHLMPADVTVKYWIATDNYGSIGIHDAYWRGSEPNYTNYGGVVYKGKGEAGTRHSGSHGCINTPKSKVKIIFENISVGTPIYIY